MGLWGDVKTVRAVAATKCNAAHIWGSFQTAEFLEEYYQLCFIQNPQV